HGWRGRARRRESAAPRGTRPCRLSAHRGRDPDATHAFRRDAAAAADGESRGHAAQDHRVERALVHEYRRPRHRHRQTVSQTGSEANNGWTAVSTVLSVDLGSRSYPIHIGSGLLDDEALVGQIVVARQVVIITNEIVAPLYLARCRRGVDAHECHE